MSPEPGSTAPSSAASSPGDPALTPRATRRSPCLSDEPRDLLRDGHVRESDRHVRAGRQLAFAEIRVHDDVLLGERLGVIGPRRLQFGHIAVEVEIRDLVSSALLVVDRSRVRVAERVPEPERATVSLREESIRSIRGPRRSGGSRPAAGSTTRRVSTGSRRRPPPPIQNSLVGQVRDDARERLAEEPLVGGREPARRPHKRHVLEAAARSRGRRSRPPAAPRRRNRSGCASGTDQAGLAADHPTSAGSSPRPARPAR